MKKKELSNCVHISFRWVVPSQSKTRHVHGEAAQEWTVTYAPESKPKHAQPVKSGIDFELLNSLLFFDYVTDGSDGHFPHISTQTSTASERRYVRLLFTSVGLPLLRRAWAADTAHFLPPTSFRTSHTCPVAHAITSMARHIRVLQYGRAGELEMKK